MYARERRQPSGKPGPLPSETAAAETVRTLISAVQIIGQRKLSHVEEEGMGGLQRMRAPLYQDMRHGPSQANSLFRGKPNCVRTPHYRLGCPQLLRNPFNHSTTGLDLPHVEPRTVLW